MFSHFSMIPVRWLLTVDSEISNSLVLFGALAEDMPVFSSDSLEKLTSHSSPRYSCDVGF